MQKSPRSAQRVTDTPLAIKTRSLCPSSYNLTPLPSWQGKSTSYLIHSLIPDCVFSSRHPHRRNSTARWAFSRANLSLKGWLPWLVRFYMRSVSYWASKRLGIWKRRLSMRYRHSIDGDRSQCLANQPDITFWISKHQRDHAMNR